MKKEDFMRMAVQLAMENVDNGGGPFGAVIVRDDKVIATGVNRVTANHDPTAHAEVQAIREAGRVLDTFDLSGCEIYASCEPCPMCLSAIYWARIRKIYYGGTQHDAAAAGFDDAFLYKELTLPVAERALPAEEFMNDEAQKVFRKWLEKEDRIAY